eukprot:2447808-Prorocentrum_lima.AAC.1
MPGEPGKSAASSCPLHSEPGLVEASAVGALNNSLPADGANPPHPEKNKQPAHRGCLLTG